MSTIIKFNALIRLNAIEAETKSETKTKEVN